MTFAFDPGAIRVRLGKLSGTKRLAFGIFLLERALPNYFKFQIDVGVTGGGQLRAALAQCWTALESGLGRHASFITVAACETYMPDTEVPYSSLYTSAALDAVNMACSLLAFIDGQDVSDLMEMVTARYDTFYLFICQNTDANGSPAPDQEVLLHPLTQQELSYVYGDLDFLESLPGEELDVLLAASLQRVSGKGYQQLRLKL